MLVPDRQRTRRATLVKGRLSQAKQNRCGAPAVCKPAVWADIRRAGIACRGSLTSRPSPRRSPSVCVPNASGATNDCLLEGRSYFGVDGVAGVATLTSFSRSSTACCVIKARPHIAPTRANLPLEPLFHRASERPGDSLQHSAEAGEALKRAA